MTLTFVYVTALVVRGVECLTSAQRWGLSRRRGRDPVLLFARGAPMAEYSCRAGTQSRTRTDRIPCCLCEKKL